jgi:hypothetical protein
MCLACSIALKYRRAQEQTMQTITLTGMSETDLDQKQMDWQRMPPNKKIIKQWPDEHLPMKMRYRPPLTKIEFKDDQYSRRIDYEEV